MPRKRKRTGFTKQKGKEKSPRKESSSSILKVYKDTVNKALDYLKPQSGHRRSAGMPSVDGPLQLVQQAVVHEGGIFTVSIKDGSPSPRLTTHMYFNALRSMAMFRSGYLYAGRESWCKRSRLGHEPLSSHHHH